MTELNLCSCEGMNTAEGINEVHRYGEGNCVYNLLTPDADGEKVKVSPWPRYNQVGTILEHRFTLGKYVSGLGYPVYSGYALLAYFMRRETAEGYRNWLQECSDDQR